MIPNDLFYKYMIYLEYKEDHVKHWGIKQQTHDLQLTKLS
jgi:hypothetical protein